MLKQFKRVILILLSICAIVLVVGGLAYIVFNRSLAPTNGEIQVSGISSAIKITRDEYGIPHIEAETLADAALGLGYVHAQDRLWQMEVMRRAGQGRLSEVFGEATVDADVLIKTLDLQGFANRSIDKVNPETARVLSAYAKGVNEWITRENGFATPKLPPEFLILGLKPENWQSWHSSAIVNILNLTLAQNMKFEIQRLALASAGFSPAEISEIVSVDPRDNPPELPDLRQLYGFVDKGKINKRNVNQGALLDPLHDGRLPFEIGRFASNNWVVSGSRTESGKPLLANDPHLALTAPGQFYLVHLKYKEDGQEHNLVGASLPGTPFILIGRNDRVAWGLTSTGLDSQDLFLEQLNPDNSQEYKTSTGWRSFDTQSFNVKVSGGEDINISRRLTWHGPVLPEDFMGLGNILPHDHVASLQWTGLTDSGGSLNTLVKILRADNMSSFMASLSDFVSPMQNIVIADVDGNIGAISPGRIPVRDPKNLVAGRAPVPGWQKEYEWLGFVPFEEVPRIVNPESGAIATANGKWFGQDYPHHITYDWDEKFRQLRVEDLVYNHAGKHSMASMEAIQTDKYSAALVAFRDLALSHIPVGVGKNPGLLESIRKWDGQMLQQRPEPLILVAWFRHFNELVFEDDFEKIQTYFKKPTITAVLNILEAERTRSWCDNTNTEVEETCADMLKLALDEAVKELSSLQGNNWEDWRWGKEHVANGEHRPFSHVSLLNRYFPIKVESEGGAYTLMRGKWDFSDKEHPYQNVSASVFRGIFDLRDLDASRYMIFAGESGHLLSQHYSDMADMWARGENFAVPAKVPRVLPGVGKEKSSNQWILSPKSQ